MTEVSEFTENKFSPTGLHLDSKMAQTLLEQALQLPPGIYADNFASRAKFLEALDPLRNIIVESVIQPELVKVQNGSTLCLVVDGLPTDPTLPAAPVDGSSPTDKSTFVSEAMALTIGMQLGQPSLIIGEKNEALVHQITPVPGRETTQSNEGSIALKLHQDLAPNHEMPTLDYARFMPDWLILTGVSAGSGDTKTFISSIEDGMKKLDPTVRDVLFQKRFQTNPPDSFIKEHPELAQLPAPAHAILTERDGHIESSFDYSSAIHALDPADHEAARAIDIFHSALDAVKTEVIIEPGTVVLFNNRRVVHGRSAVRIDHEHTDKRWIQRTYVYDVHRIVKESMGKPWSIRAGAGMIAVGNTANPPRLLELSE